MSAPFVLPDLPYAYDALEPHIDARTMEVHHTKHHQTYVNNLNAAIEKAPELGGRSLDELLAGIDTVPEAVRTAVRNNGGGHWNHTLFWQLMAPATGAHASGPHAEGAEHAPNIGSAAAVALDEAMRASFGSYAATTDDPSATVADAYTLVNVSAGYNLIAAGRVNSITLRVDNLFDERYVDATSRIKHFAPNPGRNVSLVYKVLF